MKKRAYLATRLGVITLAALFAVAAGAAGSLAATISGNVQDPGGANLGGALITLTGPEVTQVFTTDGNGNYTFTVALDGTYRVTPSNAGLVFSPQRFDAQVVMGQNVGGLDFTSAASIGALLGDATNPLDPLAIPKYVTPLVIPPVMNTSGSADVYDIAVRQFNQQILPFSFPSTTVWSYGPTADPVPASAAPDPNSQFNYPAYTLETSSGAPVTVRWRNELVAIDPQTNLPYPEGDQNRTFLPHLLPIDQTLHWANPPSIGCRDGGNRTDCHTFDATPYTGPVPIVTHVHGAHVDPHSDGYPEAWWLPRATNIPMGYATEGSLFDDAMGQVPGLNLGYADYLYRNDQPATTLWYHDHGLGITRTNVYAGPAGFWLIRGGSNDLAAGVLPGPAPVATQGVLPLNTPGDPVRNSIREIPIVIQDRSFHDDGALFYPDSREHFDGYTGPYTDGPYSGGLMGSTDIAPVWNPEAFFNTMVVNGVTWPTMEVAPALYRLRLLNGCNSRFLNLALFEVDPGTGEIPLMGAIEHPFFQIGAEQGFLPQVVRVETGFATPLPGNGTTPTAIPGSDAAQGLLMTLAERADVIVDFRGLAPGTRIRMINTAPDAPFGGFGDPAADPATTGQVMEFVVDSTLLGASPTDPVGPTQATDPTQLAILAVTAETALPAATVNRDVSLNEEASGQVCVQIMPDGTPVAVLVLDAPVDEATLLAQCATTNPPSEPMAPKAAEVGIVDFTNPSAPVGVPLAWTDMTGTSTDVPIVLQNGGVAMVPVTENPKIIDGVAPVENWHIYNFTEDAHPIHLHLVRFQVIDRQVIPGFMGNPFSQQPWETGYKDTVIAYPGEITTVRARFDVAGLYVWHCHIVEHEDNEMMRPYVVSEFFTDSLGVFRGNGLWYFDVNNNGAWDPGTDVEGYFGQTGDQAVVGDIDGNKIDDPCVFRGDGLWYCDVNNNGAWDPGTDFQGHFGQTGDQAVMGDINGDGLDDPCVFRGDGLWYCDVNNNGAWDPGTDFQGHFGQTGDQAVMGDVNGDGFGDPCVFRGDGLWYCDVNGNGAWDPGTDSQGHFGLSGDVAVVGDVNADGSDDMGVYRNGLWYFDVNNNGAWDPGTDREGFFGLASDIPVVGNIQ